MCDISNILGIDDNLTNQNQSGVTQEDFPIGTVVQWYNNQPPPSSWLLLNGSTFNQSDYPALYTFLGNTNILPDFRGKFLRGKTDVRNVGDSELGKVGSHQHALSGSTLQSGAHLHTTLSNSFVHPLSLTTSAENAHNHSVSAISITDGTTNSGGAHTHNINYQNNQTGQGLAFDSGATAVPSGSYQTESSGAHTHTVSVTVPAHNTSTVAAHTHTITQNTTINVPPVNTSEIGTHSHQIGGFCDLNAVDQENIPANIAIQYMIKAKVGINGNADPVNLVSSDRIIKDSGSLIISDTQLVSNKTFNMSMQRIQNVGFAAGPNDAISLAYLNTNDVVQQGIMDSKDNAVKALYQAADAVLQTNINNAITTATNQNTATNTAFQLADTNLQNQINAIVGVNNTQNTAITNVQTVNSAQQVQIDNLIANAPQQDRIIDNLGNYLQISAGELFASGLTNANLTNTVIQAKTDKNLYYSLVNVNALETDFKSVVKSTDTGANQDIAGFNVANQFNVLINNTNKLQLTASTASCTVPFTSQLTYNGLNYASFTADQQIVNKVYVDTYVANQLSGYVPISKYAKFQSFNDSSWGLTTHNLGNGSVYLLKPNTSFSFIQSFNAYVPITLQYTGGFQYLRCLQTGIYEITVNMHVKVGLTASPMSLATWASTYFYGRHMEWPVTSGPQAHRYSSMLSALINNSLTQEPVLRGTKSIFEIVAGLTPLTSDGNNPIGNSYDGVTYNIEFTGLCQLLNNTNYFIAGPAIFGVNIPSNVISSVYDCSVNVKLLE